MMMRILTLCSLFALLTSACGGSTAAVQTTDEPTSQGSATEEAPCAYCEGDETAECSCEHYDGPEGECAYCSGDESAECTCEHYDEEAEEACAFCQGDATAECTCNH